MSGFSGRSASLSKSLLDIRWWQADSKRKVRKLSVHCCMRCLICSLVALLQVFSAFGFVQKIAIFEKQAGFQALVQYPGKPEKPVSQSL